MFARHKLPLLHAGLRLVLSLVFCTIHALAADSGASSMVSARKAGSVPKLFNGAHDLHQLFFNFTNAGMEAAPHLVIFRSSPQPVRVC